MKFVVKLNGEVLDGCSLEVAGEKWERGLSAEAYLPGKLFAAVEDQPDDDSIWNWLRELPDDRPSKFDLEIEVEPDGQILRFPNAHMFKRDEDTGITTDLRWLPEWWDEDNPPTVRSLRLVPAWEPPGEEDKS